MNIENIKKEDALTKNNTAGRSANFSGWIKQIMRDGSHRRARSITNYVLNSPLSERDMAMKKVIRALASHRGQYIDRGWYKGLDLIAHNLISCSIEKRDYTFLNFIFSTKPSVQPSPYQIVCTELMITSFEFIGAEIEHTRLFCRAMFSDLAEQLAPKLGNGFEGLREYLDNHTPLMVAVIWETAYSPVGPNSPLKGWFVRLIKEYDQTHDEEVYRWLETAWGLLTYKNSNASIFDQGAFLEFLTRCGISFAEYCSAPFNPEKPILVLPKDAIKPFSRFLSTMHRRHTNADNEASEWCRWFHWFGRQTHDEISRLRQEIIKNSSRLIHPDGHDSVDVRQLTVLRDIGVESIAFYPDGSAYPQMQVRFSVRMFGDLTAEICGRITDKALEVDDKLFGRLSPVEIPKRRKVLEFIVWDCLHRLVVTRERNAGDGSGNSHGSCRTRLFTGYAPHWQFLPDGKQASRAAIDRCLALYQFRPPDGYTFNKGYVPDGGGEKVFAVRPRLVLTNEAIVNGK